MYQLVQRMESNQFIIRDAREIVNASGIEIAFHCKYYICDDSILCRGSGNYTGRGLQTTIEQAAWLPSFLRLPIPSYFLPEQLSQHPLKLRLKRSNDYNPFLSNGMRKRKLTGMQKHGVHLEVFFK